MKKKLTAVALVVCMLAIMLVGASLAYFTDTEAKTNTFTMGKVDIELTEPNWDNKTPNGAKLMPGTVIDKDPTITAVEKSEDAYLFLDVIFNKYNSLFWVMAADASADEKIDFTIYNDDGTAVAEEYQNPEGKFSTSKFMAAMQDPTNKEVFQKIVNKWFGGINHTDWEIRDVDMGKLNKSCFTLRLAYIGGDGVISAGEKVKFMNTFGMPSSVTQEMIDAGHTVGGQDNTFNTTSADFKLTFKAYAIQSAELTLDEAYTALFNK